MPDYAALGWNPNWEDIVCWLQDYQDKGFRIWITCKKCEEFFASLGKETTVEIKTPPPGAQPDSCSSCILTYFFPTPEREPGYKREKKRNRARLRRAA